MSRASGRDDARNRRLVELHERLAPDLLRYLERRVSTVEDAADLLAETFITAWRHLGRLPAGDEEARMWMFVTARNVSNNWRRGHQRRTDLANVLRDELIRAATASGPDKAQVLDVRAAVSALPDELKEIVTLVHWDGFSVPEAARIVRIRESTARGRYQRARARLKVALEDTDSHPSKTARAISRNEARSNP